jgi:hypothetical protein
MQQNVNNQTQFYQMWLACPEQLNIKVLHIFMVALAYAA